MGQKQDWEKKLDASIKRVEQAFDKNKGSAGRVIEALIVAAGTEALEHVSEAIKRKQDERAEREEKRREREERRRRRKLEEEAAARPQGLIFGLAAAIALTFAILNADTLWWLFSVAFGFSMASVSLLSKASQRDKMLAEKARQQPAGLPAAAGEPAVASAAQSALQARLARVDGVCAKILAEIKSGPQIVREVIHRPQETIEALRKACHELTRREADLRAAITPEEDERLRRERDALSMRIGAERDEVVRGRLGMAFRALEEQLAQRAELATAASRYEAEGTRILYTLENLHTQILRARSADASSPEIAGAGLRRSLEQLSDEIDAVSEALETVNRMDANLSPVVPISDGDGSAPGGRGRDRA